MRKTRFIIILFLFIPAAVGCLLSCKPDKVSNLGIFGKNRIEYVLGQDGCTPVPIDDSIMMWTFADTILGSWKGELSVHSTFEKTAIQKKMISNSLAFTGMPSDETINNLQFSYLKKKGSVVKFITPRKNEDTSVWRFWAIDGIRIGHTIYVYYMIVKIDFSIKGMPFKVTGIGIAEWEKPLRWKIGDPVSFKRLGKLFNEGEPLFGDCVIKKGEYVYLIGHGKPDPAGQIGAYFARVKPGGITSRKKYEYLTKSGDWSKNPALAHGYIGEIAGEPSLSFNPHLNKYIIIYCSLKGSIRLVQFDSFKSLINSRPRTVYTPAPLKKIEPRPFLFYYSGKEIFFTRSAIYAIYIHPAIYQPILLKIPYNTLEHLSP
ncbi:MAG: DUF4185 domain-containing protein [bacterium]|nr:DUF4185 domain-containing protein [bacterium]